MNPGKSHSRVLGPSPRSSQFCEPLPAEWSAVEPGRDFRNAFGWATGDFSAAGKRRWRQSSCGMPRSSCRRGQSEESGCSTKTYTNGQARTEYGYPEVPPEIMKKKVRSLMLVQSHPKGHLLLLELHTHPRDEIQLQLLLLRDCRMYPSTWTSPEEPMGSDLMHSTTQEESSATPAGVGTPSIDLQKETQDAEPVLQKHEHHFLARGQLRAIVRGSGAHEEGTSWEPDHHLDMESRGLSWAVGCLSGMARGRG